MSRNNIILILSTILQAFFKTIDWIAQLEESYSEDLNVHCLTLEWN